MRSLRKLSVFLTMSVAALVLTATPASAATTINPNLSFSVLFGNNVTYGSVVTVNVTCNGCVNPDMGGTTSLFVNGVSTSTISWPAQSRSATFTWIASAIGSDTLKVISSGDSKYAAGTTAAQNINVGKANGFPVLEVENNGSYLTAGIPYTVDFGPGFAFLGNGVSASGLIDVKLDGTELSQYNFPAGWPFDTTRSVQMPALTVGTHTLVATYSGDANWTSGVNTLSLTVEKLNGLQWPGDFDCPPGGTVYPCAPQYDTGEEIDVEAVPGLFQLTDNSPVPTGAVKFFLNNVFVGTAPLDEDGVATFATSINKAGNYSYTFTYDGDQTYQASPGAGLYFLTVNDPNNDSSIIRHVGNSQMVAGHGYRVVSANGSTYNSQVTTAVGDASNLKLNRPMVGAATTPDGMGYWQVAGDGGIFSYGDAKFFGSTGSIKLNKPIVGMASTPSGNGYWLVASDGGIFAYGDATFYGSTGSIKLNKPVVGMTPTADGKGYWLVASDGGIFAYGDAKFLGSTGSIKLNKPVVGMTATPSGNGYLFVASDGGIFAYGDATFYGSLGGSGSGGGAPVVGVLGSDSGNGYTLVAADGGIYNYGDAVFLGSGSTKNAVAIIGGD